MATVNPTRQLRVLQTVRRIARKAFGGRWDTEEQVSDAVSVAWQFYQAKPDAPANMLAHYAIRRVCVGRQFQQSVRSIDGPTGPHQAPKPARHTFVMAFAREADDPAEVAGFRIDFQDWFESLTDRERAFLELFVLGGRTGEIAEIFDCSPSRVSQMRRQLVEDWQARMG